MRKTIRDTALAAIENLPGLTLARIGRRHKLNADQLPAAIIFTDREETERISFQPIQQRNVVELVIRLTVKPSGIDQGEDTVDELLAAIDAAVLPAVRAVSGVLDVMQESIDNSGDGGADADYLKAKRTYKVEYITTA